MAQYKEGTVSVTNGSAVITGSGTDWSNVLYNIKANDSVFISGDAIDYRVLTVDSATQITLTGAVQRATGSGLVYAVSKDFTPNLDLPLLGTGDIRTDQLFTRAMNSIDSAIGGGVFDLVVNSLTSNTFVKVGTNLILDSDEDSYITSPSDDRIDVYTGGSVALTVLSGDVGIGTTSPGQTLDVVGIAQATRFYVTDGNAVVERSSGALSLQTYAGNHILLQPGGNVGIGTTAPSTPLHVVSTAADIATFEAPTTGGQIRLYRGTSFGWDIGITGGSSFTIGPDGGSTFFTLNSSGAAGFGTTSPTAKLTAVASGTGISAAGDEVARFISNGGTSFNASIGLVSGNAASTRVLFGDSDDVDVGYIDYRHGSDLLVLGVNASDRLAITSTGNVGIGTTSPTSPLHVSGTGSNPVLVETTNNSGRIEIKAPITPAVRVTATGGADYTAELSASYADESMILRGGSGYKILTATGFSTPEITNLYSNNTLAVTIDGSQRVGIGTTAPADIVEARGAMRASDSTSQYIRFDPTPATSAYTFITSLTNSGIEQVGNSTGRPFIWKLGASEVLRLTSTTGSTGGGGSAGAGNQYVELEINGQRYKLLHDGTV